LITILYCKLDAGDGSAITHTDVMNFDYMKLCPNLTSISIGDMAPIRGPCHKINNYMVSIANHTFPNIITIKCKCSNYIQASQLHKSFTGVKNIWIDYGGNEHNSWDYPYIVDMYKVYPKIEMFAIANAIIRVRYALVLVNCKIPVTLTNCISVTLQNCTVV
jgi:hypothetical protein